MSTSDLPRHDSGVDADGSTQPSTLPLTHTPAPALPSQQSPEPEQRLQGESQDSSVTVAGDSESGDSESDDSDCDGSDCEHEDSGLDANGVHFCLDVSTLPCPFVPLPIFFLVDLHNLTANCFSLAVLRPLPS